MRNSHKINTRYALRNLLRAAAALAFSPAALLAGAASLAPALLADAGTGAGAGANASAPAAGTGGAGAASTDEVTVLEKVDVTAEGTDATRLALRPTSSLYGFDELVSETPRSVFQITKAQLDTDNIRSFTDFSRYSPSIRRGSTSPYSISNIRGSTADTARNGTILFNPAIRPFDNNAWESVDIVAGVPSVSQGGTARTSGYVNYITKRPYFDGDHTVITGTVGRLGTNGATTYNQYSAQLDHSVVLIKDELAARISVQRSEAKQYWGNTAADFKDVYGAVTWKPNKKVTVDANFTYLASEGAMPFGINRIDQELISNWTYRTGSYVPQITYPYPAVGVTSTAYTYNPALGGYTTSTTPAGSVEFALGSEPWSKDDPGKITFVAPEGYGTTRKSIQGNEIVESNGAHNNKATEYIAQVITTAELNEHFTFVNRNTYQYISNVNNAADFYYSEHPNRLFESRFELQSNHEFKVFGVAVRHQSNTGISYRHVLNGCDSAVSDLNGSNVATWTDVLSGEGLDWAPRLSSPVYTVRADDVRGVQPYNLGGSEPFANRGVIQTGYGWVDWEPSWAQGDSYRSLGIPGFYAYYDRRWNTLRYHNLFTEHKFDIDKFVTLRAAARVSYIDDKIEHTSLTKYFLDAGAITAPRSDSYRGFNYQANGSITVRPVQRVNLYATYDYSQTITGCGCCEADGWSFFGVNKLDKEHFDVPSELYEVGAKFDIIPGKLTATAAWFRQTRNNPYTNPFTNQIYLTTSLFRGAEFALTWQPARNTLVGVNYSYIHVTSKQTGVRDTGQPLHTFNLWGSYQLPNGLGAKATFWLTSSWNVSNAPLITVPAQYNLDIGFFYTRKIWNGTLRADLDVLNVTDEKNWGPSGGIGGNTYTYLLPLERLGAQLKVSYAF